MNVTSNAGDMTALMETLAKRHAPLAMRRAANRTRDRVLTLTRRGLRSQFKLGAIATRRVFKARKGSPRSPVASFKVGQWVVPVEKLGKVTERKKGVAYNTPSGRVTNPSAFIVNPLGGGVFQRRGSGRLPIQKITASIADPVEAVLSQTASDSVVREIFDREVRETLDYRVQKDLARWRRAN
jgi:hypothetical protein